MTHTYDRLQQIFQDRRNREGRGEPLDSHIGPDQNLFPDMTSYSFWVEGHLNPGLFNPKLQPHELFNPGLFNHEFLNHGVDKFMVEKFMVKKSGIEEFMVEKSGVEA